MKKILLIASILLLCKSVQAKDLRFTCNFKVEEKETGTLVVRGQAYVQGKCYRCDTDGGMMYCDGDSRWIYQSETDELVIQHNDLSMFEDLDLSEVSSGEVSYIFRNFKVYLTEIKIVETPWPETFFMVDPASYGENTIVTDLR